MNLYNKSTKVPYLYDINIELGEVSFVSSASVESWKLSYTHLTYRKWWQKKEVACKEEATHIDFLLPFIHTKHDGASFIFIEKCHVFLGTTLFIFKWAVPRLWVSSTDPSNSECHSIYAHSQCVSLCIDVSTCVTWTYFKFKLNSLIQYEKRKYPIYKMKSRPIATLVITITIMLLNKYYQIEIIILFDCATY